MIINLIHMLPWNSNLTERMKWIRSVVVGVVIYIIILAFLHTYVFTQEYIMSMLPLIKQIIFAIAIADFGVAAYQLFYARDPVNIVPATNVAPNVVPNVELVAPAAAQPKDDSEVESNDVDEINSDTDADGDDADDNTSKLSVNLLTEENESVAPVPEKEETQVKEASAEMGEVKLTESNIDKLVAAKKKIETDITVKTADLVL